MPLVYLAGSISGLSYDDTTSWRREVAIQLAGRGIRCSDPMRDVEHLAGIEVLQADYPDNPMTMGRGIMTRDFNDVVMADAVFANLLGAPKPSLGTAMELAWAYQARKPVVLVMEPYGNPNDHPMVREAASLRVSTLEEGVRLMSSILSPAAFPVV